MCFSVTSFSTFNLERSQTTKQKNTNPEPRFALINILSFFTVLHSHLLCVHMGTHEPRHRCPHSYIHSDAQFSEIFENKLQSSEYF